MSLDNKAKDTEVNNFDIEELSSELKCGKFHWLNLSITSLVIFLCMLSSQVFVFAVHDPVYRCLVPECETNATPYDREYLRRVIPVRNGEFTKCERFSFISANNISEEETCSFYSFDYMKTEKCPEKIFREKHTFVEEFDITCIEWKLSFVGTVNGLAHIINYFVSGVLADKYGRKFVMIFMCVSTSVIGTIQSFSNDYWTFLIFEFINMAVSSGSYTSAFILCIELLPKEKRLMGSAILNASCGLSNAFLGLLAWNVTYWRHLLIASNIPSLFILIAIYAIPESYLWLYSQERYGECAEIIKKAAFMNGIDLSKRSKKIMECLEFRSKKFKEEDNTYIKGTDDNPGLKQLIKSKTLLIRLGVNCFVWFITLFVYDGLTITSVSLGASDNIYVNYILVALIEVPGHLIFLLVLNRYGRKRSLIASLYLSGIVIVFYTFIPISFTGLLFLTYMMGKLIITIASDVIYIYTSEMFPTSIRNLTLNISSLFGAVGVSLAPQVPLLGTVVQELPMFVFGITPIIAAFSAETLPETLGVDLPATIKEAENIGNVKRYKSKNDTDNF